MQNSQTIIKHLAEIYGLSDCKDPLAKSVHLPHAYSTLRYARLLWDDELPDSLAVAAFAHDRDRIFEADALKKSDFPPTLEGLWKYKSATAKKGANLLRQDLQSLPAPIVDDITYLVLHHEEGGERRDSILMEKPDSTKTYNLNYAADILREADALSFFDILHLYEQHRGKAETKTKIKYSLARLGSKSLPVLNEKHPDLVREYL